jgi:hypothetical protein
MAKCLSVRLMSVRLIKKTIRIFFYPSYGHFTLAGEFLNYGRNLLKTWGPQPDLWYANRSQVISKKEAWGSRQLRPIQLEIEIVLSVETNFRNLWRLSILSIYIFFFFSIEIFKIEINFLEVS